MPEEEPCAEPKPEREPLGWPFWLILAVLIMALAGLTQPRVIRSRKVSDQTDATRNLRQIGLALSEFENDFGEFPNEHTADIITQASPKHGYNLSGTSSNALFRQLFAANPNLSEQMLYAKIPRVRKPDGDISHGKLLEKGEVGFAYIAGLSSEGNPARPIAFAPVIQGTKRFDPKPFDGYALFLFGDNSVRSTLIGKDGEVIQNGVNILSAENPIWDGKAPDIRYPE